MSAVVAKPLMVIAAVLFWATTGASAAEEVSMRTIAWPAAMPCKPCTTIQYGQLEIGLPPSVLGKVLVLPRTDGAVFLVPPSGDIKAAALLMEAVEERNFDLFRKLALVKREGLATVGGFFDAVGTPANGDADREEARKLALGDRPASYTKATKGRLSVYRVVGRQGESHVRFVIAGEGSYYELSGPVSPALYRAVLANLRIVAVP